MEKITDKSIEGSLQDLLEKISDLRLTIGRTEEGIYQPQPCSNGGCEGKPCQIIVTDKINDACSEIAELNIRMCAVEKTVINNLRGLRLE